MLIDYGRIGFIGLGAMGKPMAQNLVKAGYPLLIYDVNKAVYGEFKNLANVQISPTVREFRECAVTILIVPNSQVVNEIVLGEKTGLINILGKSATIIDMSSSVASSTKRLGEVLAQREINLVDAPVSGGPVGAVAANLSVMVGGPRELYDLFLPLLQTMGKQVQYVGALGSGHLVKSLNNLLSATTFLATAEVLLLGKKMGLSPKVMLDIFNASTSRSYTTELKYPKYILSRAFNANATVETYYKDMRNALDCAADYEVPQFLGSVNVQLWRNLMSQGLAKEDYTVIVKHMEMIAGVELVE